jgi:hypothetical protein
MYKHAIPDLKILNQLGYQSYLRWFQSATRVVDGELDLVRSRRFDPNPKQAMDDSGKQHVGSWHRPWL